MIKKQFDWELTEIDDQSGEFADFLKMTKKLKLDKLTSELLWARNLRDKTAIEAFLKPSLDQLHDPFLLHDMDKAVARILQAVENGEQILIYGDYDADGMTSASIMKSALDEIGADEITQVYLPNRFTDGYGPNLDVYKYWIEKEAISLIITVDNGVSGFDEVAWAQAHGCDVVITDHHSLPEKLPEAYATVHPSHPEADYPFKDLCGAGVAFKVACALLDSIPLEMLDLVAIGTIADMVSLTDENRVLVSLGLQELKNTDRVGLIELMRLAAVDMDHLDEETIGFQIAPRLNALGRMDDPNPAIDLLLSWDEEAVLDIAKMIDAKNQERKSLVEKMTDEAKNMLTDEPVQILYQTGWHKGVLGIVAGRILNQIHKPVIVLSEEDGVLRGSGRSVDNFNIFEALDQHRELFVAFGGHAQACGLTIEKDKIADLKEVMNQAMLEQEVDQEAKAKLFLAAKIELEEISLDSLKSINKLAPFGMDNPKPKFLLENFEVEQARTMGANNSHLKLRLSQAKSKIDAIYFGHGSEKVEFEQVSTQLAVSLAANSWNGQTTVQLMIDDAVADEIELIDARRNQLEIDKNFATIYENNSVKNDIISDVLLVKEAPLNSENFQALRNLIQEADFKMIVFENQIKQAYYLSGSGTREEYARLYKTIFQYPEFDLRNKLAQLATYLKIPQILLVKMIQIFEELGFVSINDGVMTVVKDAARHEISESKIYQELEETVKLQELFALSPVKKIYGELTK